MQRKPYAEIFRRFVEMWCLQKILLSFHGFRLRESIVQLKDLMKSGDVGTLLSCLQFLEGITCATDSFGEGRIILRQ